MSRPETTPVGANAPIAPFLPRLGLARLIAVAVLLSLCLAIPDAARAGLLPPLVVLPASGHGVSAAIIERARALLVGSLGRPGRFHVVDYDRPPTAIGPGSGFADAVARFTGARVAVWLDLSREAGSTVFDLWCWGAQNHRPSCHLREATTAGPELLPDFAEWLTLRLIRALDGPSSETGPGTTALGAVTNGGTATAPAPAPAPARMLTFGVRAGLTMPIESPAHDRSPLGGFSILMAADGGNFLADVGLDYQSGADARHLRGIGLDLFLPLGGGTHLPYVGAGAWFVDENLGGRGASGLQLRPALGMLWGRHEVARLRIEAAYFVDVFKERELDRLFPGNGQGHVAHGLMISTGATF